METYLKEKSDIATYILQGEWNLAHDKSLELLKKEPENIEFIIFVTATSTYGGFFQDALEYGKKVLIWAQDNNKNIKEYNSIGLSIVDIQEFIVQAYFGLKNYSAAADELDMIKESYGYLPDSTKQFAVKNENMLNGADAALDLVTQLTADFANQESEEFLEFKCVEASICINEVNLITENAESLTNLSLVQAQKAAKYILRLVECFEGIHENRLDENGRVFFKLGKQWLSEISLALYIGGRTDHPVIESDNYYPAIEQCIMILEKLSDMGEGFAQYLLGNIYAGGFHVKEDQIKAFSYYKSAYENGENHALVNLAFYYNEGVVTAKDLNKALEYAKKAMKLEHKKASGFLIQLAQENVDNFDEKLQFILDTNKKLETNINALGTGYVSELGKKYARDYMEIEKYYIAPEERLAFLNVCLNVQVDLVTTPKGIVSGDFFIDQFEKLIEEDYETVLKIIRIRQFASRIQDLSFLEMTENIAAGNNNINDFNWHKIQEYYFPKALELGWDGYYADGTGPWKPELSVKSNERAALEEQTRGTIYDEMLLDKYKTYYNEELEDQPHSFMYDEILLDRYKTYTNEELEKIKIANDYTEEAERIALFLLRERKAELEEKMEIQGDILTLQDENTDLEMTAEEINKKLYDEYKTYTLEELEEITYANGYTKEAEQIATQILEEKNLTMTPSSANNGGCYVATAIYGSYDCPEVWTLRRYRDYKLAMTFWGRIFIRAYYTVSPTIVKWFGTSKWFKKIWHPMLNSIVKSLWDEGFDSTPYEDRNC